MSAKRWLFGLLCGGAFAVLGASAVLAAEDSVGSTTEPAVAAASDDDGSQEAVYAPRGTDTCLKCHDTGKAVEILRTAHAVKGDARTPLADANHGCETCHGASPDHLNSHPAKGEKRASPAIMFSGPNKASAEKINKVCLGCHENSARINWQGSQHDVNGNACTNCHTLHTTEDKVLAKDTQFKVCFQCHTQQRAESYALSHHPVREGKVACADCHSVHGSPGDKLLKEVRLNDTCYNCHAEKRGPLLFEHQPVRELCTSCHVPHGSNNQRLLTERLPDLCADCHNGGGFNGSTDHANGYGISIRNKDAFGRACMNCHTQIHGSNNPAGYGFFR